MGAGLKKQPLLFPPVTQRLSEVSGAFWPLADVQGMRDRDLHCYLAPLMDDGIYTPVQAESRAPQPSHSEARPPSLRDAASSSKKPFNDEHS